jgi:ketosteroid isomerase-like protein
MSDREEIENLLNRFLWVRDDRDYDGMRACITDDFTYVAPGVNDKGEPRIMAGADAFIAGVRAFAPRTAAVQHHHTTLIVAVDGDEAQARAYVLYFMVPAEGDGTVVKNGGRASYRLRRERGGWRISHSDASPVWGENMHLMAPPKI